MSRVLWLFLEQLEMPNGVIVHSTKNSGTLTVLQDSAMNGGLTGGAGVTVAAGGLTVTLGGATITSGSVSCLLCLHRSM